MAIFIDPTGKTTYGIGICARCSKKFPLEELHDDPNSPGLKVCLADMDDFDPYRLAARPTEDINLPFVRPDRRVDDVSGDPSFSLFYIRVTAEDGRLRVTESGQFREIEQAPDGGTPPWEL